jgi:hypothetical protein
MKLSDTKKPSEIVKMSREIMGILDKKGYDLRETYLLLYIMTESLKQTLETQGITIYHTNE